MDMTMAVVSDNVRFQPDPTSNSPGPRLDIIDVFDEVLCKRLPCLVPRVYVTVGFSADAASFGRQVVVWVRLLSPEGATIDEKQELCTVQTPLPSRSRYSFYPTFRFQNVLLPAFGPYVFRVWVGEEHKIDLPMQASQSGG